jgi:hypothetical protein
MPTKSAKKPTTKPAPNGRVIDVSAIEWGAPEPVKVRRGQWYELLTQFAENPGKPGHVPCPGYSKKYLAVVSSNLRNGRAAAKSFDGSFDVRVTDDDGELGLWIRYTKK